MSLQQSFLGTGLLSLALHFSIATEACGAGQDWVKLIGGGKDKQAAAQIDSFVNTLDLYKDEGLRRMLRALSISLEKQCQTCDEKSKITLFRGITDNENIGTESRPLLVARALRNAQGLSDPRLLLSLRNMSLDYLQSAHMNWSRQYASPFVGTSLSSWIATRFSNKVMVLKVCPDRIHALGNSSEHEVLLPLLIHPSEVLAIIDTSQNPNVEKGRFDFIYLPKNSGSEDRVRRQIQSYARAWKSTAKGLVRFMNQEDSAGSKTVNAKIDAAEEEFIMNSVLTDAVLKKMFSSPEGRESVIHRFLLSPRSADRPIVSELMDKLTKSREDATILRWILRSNPALLKHPQAASWIDRLIDFNEADEDLFTEHLANQPKGPQLVIKYIKSHPEATADALLLSRKWWANHPLLRELCNGAKPSSECLRELNFKMCLQRALGTRLSKPR